MIDIDFLSPRANQTILTKHIEALSRGQRGTGVVYGNKITPSDPASMVIQIAAGRIRIVGAPMDVDADSIELDTAHATLPRMDLIYRDTVGDGQYVKGTPAAIEDPKSLSDWKSYTAPLPAADIPQGAILGAVYVGPGVAAITASDIWMFAVGVEDITTVVDDPGVDTRSATEKAIRDALEATCAPIAKGVTNGDAHDHNGGDGAQIDHTTLASKGTNTHSQIDTHIASTSNPHSTTASQVGADVTTSTIHAATQKDTLADADELQLLDSESSYALRKATFGNIRAKLKDFNVNFSFGDGLYVVLAGQQWAMVPVASKITAAYLESRDSTGALLSGSITCTLYKFTIGQAIGSAVDTFALSAASSYSETGLNIAVAANSFLMIVVSGIATCKQVLCVLKMERT